jgi:DNA (cytosine-5)-methyltransferase 1
MKRPTVIDLFGGAGGTGLGFVEAQFNVLTAVELDRCAAATYAHNLGVCVERCDVRMLSPRELRLRLRMRRYTLDVLAGCPPCQGFTRMRNSGGAADRRNALVLRYLAFAREFLPKYAVFENVPGLLTSTHGRPFFLRLENGLRELGYSVEYRSLEAADFGVPQLRERLIVIAARSGYPIIFPEPTHGEARHPEVLSRRRRPWLTVRDAIGGGKYPPVAAASQRRPSVPNHVAARTGTRVRAFIARVPRDGGSRRDVDRRFWLDCHKAHDGHYDVYGRLAWDRPANTITSGCTNPSKGRFVHPTQTRGLTFREAAALQGFPDSFVFVGDGIDRQIGNAVPPPLARAIADSLRNGLRTRAKHPRSALLRAGD